MRKLVPALLFLIPVLPSRAQSINVDIEPAGGPYGLPTPYYGGSAGAPGVWNSVNSVSVTGLKRWDGVATGVSFTLDDPTPGCGTDLNDPVYSQDIAGTSGEDESLLDDLYSPNGFVISGTFEGLEPGDYVVDTIMVKSACQSRMLVSVDGSPDPEVLMFPNWSGSYVFGQSYVRHRKTVTDGTIRIRFEVDGHVLDYMFLNGIQLDMGEQEMVGVPMCFGDGSARDCPCANNGRPGRGCENSSGTRGATLFATGTTSPDTVVLSSMGELPVAFSLFLQGTTSISPVFYGDGLRCVGGTFKRLYAKNASDGNVTAPQGAEPSVSARSAALGDTIPSGATRHYFVSYRTPVPDFCPDPPGGTFNSTNSISIVW